MRLGVITRVGMAAVVAVLTAGSASAQSWYAAPTPGNAGNGAYWNNKSSDNATAADVCNIGAVLMGFSQNSNCNAEVPSGLLPLSSTQALPGSGVRGAFLAGANGNAPAGFMMVGGMYRFDLYGKIAGAAIKSGGTNPRMGYFTFNSFGQRILTELALAPGASATFQTGGSPVGFWVAATSPTASAGNVWAYFSDMGRCQVNAISLAGCGAGSSASQQFALFAASTVGAPSISGGVVNAPIQSRYWLGVEDVSPIPGAGSDNDYNDVVASFTSLPEPASFALLGTGLLGVFAVGRRRRK